MIITLKTQGAYYTWHDYSLKYHKTHIMSHRNCSTYKQCDFEMLKGSDCIKTK